MDVKTVEHHLELNKNVTFPLSPTTSPLPISLNWSEHVPLVAEAQG